MSSQSERVHSLLESAIAEKYKQQGFEVITQPNTNELPFDLGTYRPDIIAKKSDGEGYIIEVKGSVHKTAIDRYREVADIVSEHPGWRFLLITSDDIRDSNLPNADDSLLTWEQMLRGRARAERSLDRGAFHEAFLSLWAIFEAMLRRRAAQVSIPVERFPTSSLIKHLYSQGELSIEQFDTAMALQSVRNRLVHGYQVPEVAEPANLLQKLILELLSEWGPQSSPASSVDG